MTNLITKNNSKSWLILDEIADSPVGVNRNRSGMSAALVNAREWSQKKEVGEIDTEKLVQ